MVRIKDADADHVFNDLDMKLRQGGRLTRSDLFPLLLAPLMSGNMDVCGRICRGMDIDSIDFLSRPLFCEKRPQILQKTRLKGPLIIDLRKNHAVAFRKN